MHELVFLKLGGSLITDKLQKYTPRLDKLEALAIELRDARAELPKIQLILGHGSGSFGHYAVQEHLNPRTLALDGKASLEDKRAYWSGFSEVWYRAAQLNRYVMDALHGVGLAAVSLPPSAAVTSANGKIANWDLTALRAALDSDIMPVIFGDIVFDSVQGGKVLSTEAVMMHLASELHPRRVLLAGLEAAVWGDYPNRHQPIARLTPSAYQTIKGKVSGSHGADVTGGMKSKVEAMLELVEAVPGLEVQIFSGEQEGSIRQALGSGQSGTIIARD
jgi:isopentenyl phosphate kinase